MTYNLSALAAELPTHNVQQLHLKKLQKGFILLLRFSLENKRRIWEKQGTFKN
jgi:hypothetical protein